MPAAVAQWQRVSLSPRGSGFKSRSRARNFFNISTIFSVYQQIFDRLWNYKCQGGYVKQMKEELKKFKITEKDCLNRKEYRNKIFELKTLVGEKRNPNRGEWTDERRDDHSKRMKDFWRRKKETT